jgi:hypothetical protein
MDSKYIVVFNDQKKGEAAATMLCDAMNNGALIISAVATRDSVHYLIANIPQEPQMPLNAEDRQIIRDNLDAEDAAEQAATEEMLDSIELDEKGGMV